MNLAVEKLLKDFFIHIDEIKSMETKIFEWPVRVYYEDTDCAKVVYYANYLKFLERARTEWLRSMGWNQAELLRDLGLVFVVVQVEIRYKKPAQLDDQLIVKCKLANTGHVSIVFEQEIWREDELLIAATVKCCCLDSNTYKPKSMPPRLVERLMNY